MEVEVCDICEKEIPSQSLMIHKVHCERNTIRCEKCRAPISRSEKEEHDNLNHALKPCPNCQAQLEANQFDSHKCPKAPKLCPFCEATYPLDLYDSHTQLCGNRTELCRKCNKYIPIRDLKKHIDAGNCNKPQPKQENYYKEKQEEEIERQIKARQREDLARQQIREQQERKRKEEMEIINRKKEEEKRKAEIEARERMRQPQDSQKEKEDLTGIGRVQEYERGLRNRKQQELQKEDGLERLRKIQKENERLQNQGRQYQYEKKEYKRSENERRENERREKERREYERSEHERRENERIENEWLKSEGIQNEGIQNEEDEEEKRYRDIWEAAEQKKRDLPNKRQDPKNKFDYQRMPHPNEGQHRNKPNYNKPGYPKPNRFSPEKAIPQPPENKYTPKYIPNIPKPPQTYPDISEDERIAKELAEKLDREVAENLERQLLAEASLSDAGRQNFDEDERIARELQEQQSLEMARQLAGNTEEMPNPQPYDEYSSQFETGQDYSYFSNPPRNDYQQRNPYNPPRQNPYNPPRQNPRDGFEDISAEDEMLNAAILESLKSQK